ncbi:hypothetical protein EMCRGX_G020849 [Ephydatia muelleri]
MKGVGASSNVKFLVKFQMKKVLLHLNEHGDDGDIERLRFLLSEMETEVVMKSWDLSLSASIGSAEIEDFFTKSVGVSEEPHILVHSGSNDRKFLTAMYCKNDPQSPHYGSSLQPTEQFVKVDMSVMKVQLQRGPLIKLMSMALSIMAEIKPKDQPSSATKDVVTLPKEGAAVKKVVRSGLPGERQVYIEARFGGLEVTLGDEHGDILSADMTDLNTTISMLEEWTIVTASMKNIVLVDADLNSCHSQVVSKMDDSSTVISTEIKSFNKCSMDVSSLDLFVSATVQRLKVFVVFNFLNRVMHYVDEVMEELKFTKKAHGLLEEKTISKAMEMQGTQDQKNGRKIGLSVSISAPLVVLPLTSTSSSAFVADLGQMEVANTFLFAEKVAVGQHPSEKFISSGGVPAIVDDMTVDITSVQLFQIKDVKGFNIEELGQSITKPIQFHGHVIRKLSDWCSVIPDISIDAELPSLEVQLGPGDYSAILSLMNSLSDGRSITPSSDKREGEDGGEEGVKEGPESNKPVVSSDTKDSTSSDDMKLFIKFRMAEVVLHLNEQSDGVNIERLKFLLIEMETEVVMKSRDFSVIASIGRAEIQDSFTKSFDGKCQTLLNSGSEGKKFLSATYCKNDRQSPYYGSSSPPTEQSVDADMSVVKIHLLKGSLVKLMPMGLSIMAEIKSINQPSYSLAMPTEDGLTKRTRQHLPGEREMYIEARLGGLEVTLGDEYGDVLGANMTDFISTISTLEELTVVTASMKDILVTDMNPVSCHSTVATKMDDSATVLSTKIEMFKNIEQTGVDLSSADMCVSATVQRLKVFVVFKFVNRVTDYLNEVMNELNLSKKVLELPEEKASLPKAEIQGEKEEKNGSKIGLKISISAPLVVLPLTSTSSSAFVADLGQMEVTNTFLLAEKVAVGQHPSEKFISSGGVPAIVDDMTVNITSVLLFKVKDLKDLKIEDLNQTIIQPVQFHGHVIRKLSDWCSVVPDISIDAELPSLEVQLRPGDYSAILSLVDSRGDGRSTTLPSALKEGESSVTNYGKAEEESKSDAQVVPYVPLATTNQHIIQVTIYDTIKDTSPEMERLCQLAGFAVVGLKASGSSHSNGGVKAELYMDNFTLDDERPGTTGIRQAVQKSPLKDEESRAMIHMTYTSSVQKEQSVTIKVDGTQVLVNLPFILKLVNFFMAELKPLTITTEKGDSDEAAGALITDATDVTTDRRIKITVLVNRPCIALIEKPAILDPMILVLEMAISVLLELKTERWNLDATVNSLSVSSTNYMSLGNTKTYSHVLAPTSIITASLSSQGIHCVTFPSLKLTVSPATVRLILNVIKSLQQQQQVVDELPSSAPSDLFSGKEVDKTRWYMSSKSEVDRVAQLKRLISQTYDSNVKEMMKISVRDVTIIVEKEDAIGPNIPVFVLLMGKYNLDALSIVAQDWSTHLLLDAKTSLQVDYFNTSHGVWESVLEPLVDAKTDNLCADWSLAAKVSMLPSVEQSNIARRQSLDLDPDVSIEVTSKDVLNLTLTQTCITLINELAHSFVEEGEKRDQIDSPPELYEAVCYLVNDLGNNYPVTVKSGGTLECLRGYSSTLYCATNPHELPLVLADCDRKSDLGKLSVKNLARKVHVVQLEIAGFKARSVVIGSGDKVYYSLQSLNNTIVKYGMVVEIQQQVAGKGPLVTLRAPLQIKNHLYVDVEVYWSLTRNASASLDPKCIVVVTKDGGVSNIPLKPAHEGYFVIKPRITGAGSCNPVVSYEMEGNEISSTAGSQTVHILVTKEEELYSKKNLYSLEKRPHHILHLSSPVIFKNLLPVPLNLLNVGYLEPITPGSKIHINKFSCGAVIFQLRVKVNLEGVTWIGDMDVNMNEPQASSFIMSNPEKYNLKLALHKEQKNGWKFSLYSRYWIVNKTGLTLEYESRKSQEE